MDINVQREKKKTKLKKTGNMKITFNNLLSSENFSGFEERQKQQQ